MSDYTGSEAYKNRSKLYDHLAVLGRQKSFILAFCIPAILTTLAITYAVSEKYEASTTIYYRPMERTVLLQKGSEAFGSPLPSVSFKVVNQTLLDVASSVVVLRPVVESLDLHKKNPVEGPWYRRAFKLVKETVRETAQNVWSLLKYGRVIKEDPVLEAVKNLQSNLKIASKKESYLFTLSVKYKDRAKAAAIADAVGKELVAWLKGQDRKIAGDKLAQLSSNIATNENEWMALQNQKAELLQNAGIASLSDETVKGVNNLYEIELERARYAAQLEEKRKKVEELGREMDASEKIHASADDYRDMRSRRLAETIEMKGLAAKAATLDNNISVLKFRLARMPQLQRDVDALEEMINVKKTEYRQLSEMYMEASERFANRRGEVGILNPSIVSQGPVQPIKIYHVGVTGILSLITAIGMVFVLEYLNVRIFFPSRGWKARKELEQAVAEGGGSNG